MAFTCEEFEMERRVELPEDNVSDTEKLFLLATRKFRHKLSKDKVLMLKTISGYEKNSYKQRKT